MSTEELRVALTARGETILRELQMTEEDLDGLSAFDIGVADVLTGSKSSSNRLRLGGWYVRKHKKLKKEAEQK